MFKENDLVMYGKAGVCRVFKIGTPDFASDKDSEYYFLEPLYKSGTFYAPVEGDVSIRPVISARKAKSLISGIDELKCEKVVAVSVQQLSQYYQNIVDSYKCDSLMSMIKSIYIKNAEALKNNKKLGQIDKRYMKMAEDLLFGELAVALDKDIEDIKKQVEERIEGSIM